MTVFFTHLASIREGREKYQTKEITEVVPVDQHLDSSLAAIEAKCLP